MPELGQNEDTAPLCDKCKVLPNYGGYYCEVHGVYPVSFNLNAPAEPVDYSEPVRIK